MRKKLLQDLALVTKRRPFNFQLEGGHGDATSPLQLTCAGAGGNCLNIKEDKMNIPELKKLADAVKRSKKFDISYVAHCYIGHSWVGDAQYRMFRTRFGLTHDQEVDLVCPVKWGGRRPNPKQAAKVLDHFIETGVIDHSIIDKKKTDIGVFKKMLKVKKQKVNAI